MTRRPSRLRPLIAAALGVILASPVLRADIFTWEFINPANPALGKRQSTSLAPGGAGAFARPAEDLSFRDLTRAYLISADLRDAYLAGTVLVTADLSSADLTGAWISYYYDGLSYTSDQANVSGATFTNAVVRNASFDYSNPLAPGLSLAQLYSTASYQQRDLRGIGLGAAPMAGAQFTDQDLSSARLGGANLTGAILLRARLASAGLQGTTLTNAVLTSADLTGADLTQAVLTGANLSDAVVRGASFAGNPYSPLAQPLTPAQLYSTASYKVRDLSGVRFLNADLTAYNLTSQNLTRAVFYNAKLAGMNLTGTTLDGVRFDLQADGLRSVNFTSASLKSAVIGSTPLTGATFAGADLRGTSFVDSVLTGVVFTSADVRGASFYRLQTAGQPGGLSLAQLYSTRSYLTRDLSGIDLSYNTLTNANFATQNLTSAVFNSAVLTGVNFTSADLTGAILVGPGVGSVNLLDATVRGATLGNITRNQLYSTASYKTRDLSGVTLFPDGTTLNSVNLADQKLTGAQIYLATLSGVTFARADLTDAYLVGELTGAVFTSAVVRNTAFVQPITKAQLYSTATYPLRTLGGVWINSTETGWAFADHDLAGAKLSGTFALSDFRRTDLTAASFGGVGGGTTLANSDLSSARLAGASLRSSDLTGARFVNADLTGADLTDSTFASTDFTGATIRLALLNRDVVSLGGAGLTAAQVRSTASYAAKDLTGVKLQGAALAGIDLSSFLLSNAAFRDADLSDAKFRFTDLRAVSFSSDGAALSRADFTGANAEGLYLAQAQLTSSVFASADLRGAHLTDARLTGADFTNADITAARFPRGTYAPTGTGLTPAQLASTANHAARNLAGIDLTFNLLPGVNLSGFDLRSTGFGGADLSDANLRGADLSRAYLGFVFGSQFSGATLLTRADLRDAKLHYASLNGTWYVDENGIEYSYPGPDLTGAHLDGADARGANLFNTDTSAAASRRNFIAPDGRLATLALLSGETLLIRDFDAIPDVGPAIDITAGGTFAPHPGSTLRFVFDADDWGSTIHFDLATPVALAGTLELTFADGPLDHRPRQFQLFDWTGVTPTGTFQFAGDPRWDLSRLYTDGYVSLRPSAVPEPAPALLGLLTLAPLLRPRRRHRSS